ncbi:MAG: DEAD/DEAH box helicase [Acidimicrobiia bacterium]
MTSTHDDVTTATTFASLGIDPSLVTLLTDDEIVDPFPIQEMTIPEVLAGRDVCGRAKTGSGKTLAFGLPIIQRLTPARSKRPLALILVPTRELANQVTEVLRPLARARGFSLVAVYGGVSMKNQIDRLEGGVEIVVATPGRLIDLMERKKVRFDDVSMVCIDEADQMADMGFLPQVRRIMRQVPDDRQTMLFSATLDGQVGSLIRDYMEDPVEHGVDAPTETIETMEHRFLKVHQMDKVKLAAAIANSATRTLMFVRTKYACDRVARALRDHGVAAKAIHGDLDQSKRETALASFADGTTPVLVATNVAARGLHIDNVDIVVHYDPPDDPKTYLHRSGRTARAGESGLVVTLVEWDQVNEVIGIQRRAGLNVPIVKMFSNDARLTDLASWEPPRDLAPFDGDARRRPGSPRRRRR